MQRNFGLTLVAATVVAALTTSPAAWAQAQPPIKLGVLLATSGVGASTGLGLLEGVKQAVEEINAAGGVKGRKLEILLRDTQIKPDVASAVAKELLTKEGVKIFIGPATSGEALAVSELAKNEKVVNISPSAKTEALTSTNLHDYIFQLPATTDVDGVRTSRLLKEIGAKSVCFIGFDYAYTTDLFKAVRASMGDIKDGGNLLVPITATDYSGMVSQLTANSCDTILGTMWGGGFIAFIKQATPFGLLKNKKIVWGASLGEYSVAAALKSDMPEGMWASGGDAWYVNVSDAHKKFHEAGAKMLGKPETSMWALAGYNAVNFAKAAIEKAGSSEPAAVAAALKGLTISSPLGDLTIDAKTHRVSAPELWGQVTSVPGSDVKRLAKVQVIR